LEPTSMAPRSENQAPKPRFFYGYVIVIASFIILVLGWGIYYSYGVFFSPLMDEFHWTRAVTSGAFSIAVFVSGFVGIFAGRLSDRLGPQIVITICAVSLSLGYVLMFLVQSTWQFYLLYGVLIASGVGGFWAPPVSTVARWFVDRRGLMTGIVSGGISFGTLVVPPVVSRIISLYGWRRSYLIIGVVTLVAVAVAAQFIKKSPEHVGLLPQGKAEIKPGNLPRSKEFSLKEALHTRQFWLVFLIYFCFGIALLTIIVHMVPHATGIGISDMNAAIILSVIGGLSLIGRIAMGGIADRLRVKASAIICLALLTGSLIWLQFSDGLWKLYFFAVLFGFGYGGLSCLQSLIAADLFGLTILGVMTAIFSFSYCVGGAVGPVLAGYIFDVSGSYQWAFLLCLAAVVVALLISLSLKPPKRGLQ
jgi:MFS family permease